MKKRFYPLFFEEGVGGDLVRWVIVGILILLMYKFIERESMVEVIRKSISGEEAGIMEGILLGSKEGMSKDFYNNLKISGLVHIVVASGTNLILISRILIENFCSLLGRKKTIILGLAGMWGYASIVEWQAPIVRACIFLSVKYLAQLYGRKFEWKRALGLTMIIMIGADYKMVGSISFWMSIIAFLAISIEKPKWKLMNETVWVSLWLLPLMAFAFGQISWVAPVSNLMVLFLVEVISVVGGLATIVGLVWLDLGKIIMWAILPLLRYFEWVVGVTSQAGVINLKFNWLMMIGCYLIIIYWYIRKDVPKLQ